MYYSYVEIEYVATSFSPARTDLALKLFNALMKRKTGQSPSLIVEHFPGTVTDFTTFSLPPFLDFTFALLPKSHNVALFGFIYLHVSKYELA